MNKNMKLFVFTVVMAFLSSFIIIEIAHYSVYGKFIKEKNLDAFLGQNLEKYKTYDSENLLHGFHFNAPFIAVSHSPLAKWYINGAGVIPRWSKWSKEIDRKMAEEEAAKEKSSFFPELYAK